MLYVGLDLGRKRLDWHARRPDDDLVGADAVVPEVDGLARLVHGLGDEPVVAVIESMTGARFVHDQLERAGGDVRIADAARGQGPGAPVLPDRQDRRLGAVRARPPRPGARDLAARPDGARRARAGALPPAPLSLQ